MSEDGVTRFESMRPMLRAVAFRMLGSGSEADDAVHEAWLRFTRADTRDVENLEGWLTTTVARVCLDMLRARSRAIRREQPLDESHAAGDDAAQRATNQAHATNLEHDMQVADAVGLALLVVLDRLAPIDGAVGVVVAPAGRLVTVLRMMVRDGKVAVIDVVTDPARLDRLELAVLDESS